MRTPARDVNAIRRRCALAALALATLFTAPAWAQPTFDNPSPVAGGSTSQRAGEMADRAAYKSVEYANAGRKGPQIVVLPGQVKSNNATFTQRYFPNNIADYAELELTRANFTVLERANLGGLMREFELAYNLGDPQTARRILQRGRLAATRWVVKFDILKAEPIAAAEQGFDGRVIGGLLCGFVGTRDACTAGGAIGSARTQEASRVWLVGMRYKIIDAATTEQVAGGYHEQKMEVGATSSAVLGANQGATGGTGLDTLVQRLVQLSVYELDSRYK